MSSYTVWLDVEVPDNMEDASPHEVLSSILLGALRESSLEAKSFHIEKTDVPPEDEIDIRRFMS